jgi:hypothetical protein
MYAG